MACNGCGQSGYGSSTAGSQAGVPVNPYAMTPAASGPISGPSSSSGPSVSTSLTNNGGCAGCAGRDSLWKDILTALIISIVVGGLFLGRDR